MKALICKRMGAAHMKMWALGNGCFPLYSGGRLVLHGLRGRSGMMRNITALMGSRY